VGVFHRLDRPLRRFIGHLHRFFRDPAGALEEALKIVALASAWRRMICPRSTALSLWPIKNFPLCEEREAKVSAIGIAGCTQ
jgi:hypothetical protein